MWCPEGYVSLHEISEYLEEITDLYSAGQNIDYGPEVGEGDEGYLREELWSDFWQLHRMLTSQSEIKLVEARIDVFRAWLVAQTLRQLRPRLCSPEGTILLTTDDLFVHIDLLEAGRWDRHASDRIIYRSVLKAAFSPDALDPSNGFVAFSYPSGIIFEPDEVALIYDYRGERIRSDRARDIQQIFAGWAICFLSSEAPKNVSGFIDLLQLDPDEFLQTLQSPPNTVEGLRRVYDEIMQAFPNGKLVGDTWQIVEKKTGYSRRHINRALAKFDSKGTWASGGQTL